MASSEPMPSLPYERWDDVARRSTSVDLAHLARADPTLAAVARRYAGRCADVQRTLDAQLAVTCAWLTTSIINAMRCNLWRHVQDDDEERGEERGEPPSSFLYAFELTFSNGIRFSMAAGTFASWSIVDDDGWEPHSHLQRTDELTRQALRNVSDESVAFMFDTLIPTTRMDQDTFEPWWSLLRDTRMRKLLYELLLASQDLIVSLPIDSDDDDEDGNVADDVSASAVLLGTYRALFASAPLLAHHIASHKEEMDVEDAPVPALLRILQEPDLLHQVASHVERWTSWWKLLKDIYDQAGEGDSERQFGTFMRALALHVDPPSYVRWKARAKDGAAWVTDYLDALDRFLGDTRWIQRGMPCVLPGQRHESLTIEQLERLDRLSARCVSAALK